MRIVAHISDIHFGRIDLPIAEALARFLRELQPSLLIVSGDLTQRARAWQFRQAAEYLRRLPQPQLVVPGNHDVPLYDVVRRFFAPTQYFRRHIGDQRMPIFVDDELIVVGLDSTRALAPRFRGFWKDGALDWSQVERACMKFVTRAREQTRILVTHHPFMPAPGGDAEDRLRIDPRQTDRLAKAGVDLLLAGHLHRNYSGAVAASVDGEGAAMLSIQAGTATSTRLRGVANSFNVLRIETDRLELLVHRWNGLTFVADEPQLFIRDAAGWHAQH